MGNTIPGGYYLDARTGKHVDAWGNPVEKQSDTAIKKSKEEGEELTPDQAEIMAQQARTARAAQEAREAAERAEAAEKAAKVRGSRK